MRQILIDTDAFNCIRRLSLLQRTCSSTCALRPLILTGYVARHELSDLATEIADLETRGCVRIEAVEVDSPTGKRWRMLRKAGVHKGEAEAVAWAMSQPEAPLFVSADRGAREAAKQHRVPTTDVMGLVVELVEERCIQPLEAERDLEVWLDRRQEICPPVDYDGYGPTYLRRFITLRN